MEHSAILSTFIKLPLLRPLFSLFLSKNDDSVELFYGAIFTIKIFFMWSSHEILVLITLVSSEDAI